MSIATEITRLQNAKATLKTKLNAKNDSSHQIDNETLDEFGDFVDSIPTGGGGDTPTKGVILSNWDNDGFAGQVEVVGFDTVPDHYLEAPLSGYCAYSKMAKVIFDSNTTTIGMSCCQYNSFLQEIDFGGTTKISNYAFKNCTGLVSLKLPDTINQILGNACFSECSSLKKISMSNVPNINGANSGIASFSRCSALKQVWIGSGITNIPRYAFSLCNNLQKIYIDKPRATVQTFAGYNYAFMDNSSKTGIIVCNDDEGFITQEQFEALDPDEM